MRFCAEHARELEKGLPLGGVSLDPARIEILPRPWTEPKIGALHAIGPQ
jgi:hypothetical protein